ncbi:MAG: hypothetical protein J6V32_05920 [Elusimicrobiaceae bacterium]|nr:hypothetical protein [Elusimicrobiaceae bacterium]
MSKTSYALIAIMITALLYMGAVRGYQFYEQKAAEWEEERQEAADAFSFQNIPISFAAPQAEEVSRPVPLPEQNSSISILTYQEQEALPGAPEQVQGAGVPVQMTGEVFLEEVPLPADKRVQQAKDTLRSIVQDYKDEPEIKSFNQELKQVTKGQAVDLSALGSGNLQQLLKDNPQIQAVVSKHMQNPEFARKVQQILTNPQFVQSVRELQPGARIPAPSTQPGK